MDDKLSKTIEAISEMLSRAEAITPTKNQPNNQMGLLSPEALARLPFIGGALGQGAIASEVLSSLPKLPKLPEPLMPLNEAVERLRLRAEGHPHFAAATALWRAKAGSPDILADRVEKGLAGPEELKTTADILRGGHKTNGRMMKPFEIFVFGYTCARVKRFWAYPKR